MHFNMLKFDPLMFLLFFFSKCPMQLNINLNDIFRTGFASGYGREITTYARRGVNGQFIVIDKMITVT